MPRGCLRFVIVVFPDHTHLLFLVTLYLCFRTTKSGVSRDEAHISLGIQRSF